MDLVRSYLGLPTSAPPTKAPPPVATVDGTKLVRAQQVQLGQLKADLAEVEEELAAAVKARRTAVATAKIAERNSLQVKIKQLEGKMRNFIGTQEAIGTADSNLQQALLMKEGADALEEIVAKTQTVNIDDVVDKLQENAALTTEYGDRLSEPIFSQTGENEDGLSVDEEVAQMMAEQQEREAQEAMMGLNTAAAAVPNRPGGKIPAGPLKN